MSDKLKNAKEEAFCQAFAQIRRKKDAAIQAGYSETSAPQTAWKLLQKSEIQKRIAQIEAENSEHWIVEANWLLGQYVDVFRKCAKAEKVMVYDEVLGRMTHKGEYKFDSKGAISALDSIAKHIGFFEKDNSQAKNDNKIELVIKGSKSKLMDKIGKS